MDLLRVVFKCAERSEPPVHLLVGASVSRPSSLFPLRPFITVADRRATTGNLAPRGLLESTSHDVLTSLLRHGRGSARDGS